MDSTLDTRDARGTHQPLPGFVADSLIPVVHWRAGTAALLRDRRLELEVDETGAPQVRMVEGVSGTAVMVRSAKPRGPGVPSRCGSVDVAPTSRAWQR
jgi:hypothetical protein